jgi:hypothetical protein
MYDILSMDIIKNPVIIGLVAAVVTYMYMGWSIEEKNKKNKKHKKPQEEVNLMIPLVVGVILWFLAYGYFEFNGVAVTNVPVMNQQIKHPVPLAPDVGFRFTKDVIPTSSSDPKEFSLLTGGVTVPTVLPDVMIDMF